MASKRKARQAVPWADISDPMAYGTATYQASRIDSRTGQRVPLGKAVTVGASRKIRPRDPNRDLPALNAAEITASALARIAAGNDIGTATDAAYGAVQWLMHLARQDHGRARAATWQRDPARDWQHLARIAESGAAAWQRVTAPPRASRGSMARAAHDVAAEITTARESIAVNSPGAMLIRRTAVDGSVSITAAMPSRRSRQARRARAEITAAIRDGRIADRVERIARAEMATDPGSKQPGTVGGNASKRKAARPSGHAALANASVLRAMVQAASRIAHAEMASADKREARQAARALAGSAARQATAGGHGGITNNWQGI